MRPSVILASRSAIRAQLLRRAGLVFDVQAARVDEDQMRRSLLSENASAREVADALAQMKAMRISERHPGAMVIGCDQVLDLGGRILSKPETREDARDQLRVLRARSHSLLSAAVICEGGRPVWRHIGQARLTMRAFSDGWLDGYLDRNWPGVSDSVGAYKLEEEGVRLFSSVEGDYFTVLGLPLTEVLNYLTTRSVLET